LLLLGVGRAGAAGVTATAGVAGMVGNARGRENTGRVSTLRGSDDDDEDGSVGGRLDVELERV